MPSHPRLCAEWAIAIVLAAGASPRLACAQPGLTHVSPGALVPGQITEMTLHGSKLDGQVQVWTSFPARVEIASDAGKSKDRTSIPAKITLSAGAPVGIGGMAIATPGGASDVAYVMIDDLPSVADNGNNHAPVSPQALQLPVAVDGLSDGTTFDYYRVAAKAGQRIACEVVAARLGQDFDAVVRILDPAGAEVLRADDGAATGADARFAFTPPADGQYVLEVRDNRYKAGGRYRLRLGDFPLISTPLPLVATRGALTPLRFTGPLIESLAPLSVLLPQQSERASGISAKAAAGHSGFVMLGTSEFPVFEDASASDQPDAVTSAAVPGAFSGLLEAPRDRDLFQFTATKGTPVSFRSFTRSAGSGAILMLRLQDAAGKQLAESPVTDNDEPVLNFTVPEDGTYKLSVEELAGRGGPDYGYAVEARTGPQFTLSLKSDANNRLRHALAPASGALHLDVQCQRFAYDGPISLAVESERPGWQVFNSTIPAKANEVRLYVVAPLDLAPGELAALRIVGRAEPSAGGHRAEMSTTVQLRAARPQTPYPPAWLDGLILVSGAPAKASFYTAIGDKSEVTLPRLVGQTQFAVQFERTDPAFKDAPLTILPLGLPASVTAEIKRNGNGPKETYDITLKGPKDLAEGQHLLRYFAFAEMGTSGRAVQSGDIRLNVITPLRATIAPAGPLVQGQTQKVKVTLVRQGDDKQPVDVKFKSLPAGVTAAEKTTLAADQNEIDIELAAAADAAPVKFEQLIAVASSKYVGADISVESAAVALEVKAP
jgi:hypothetical protein